MERNNHTVLARREAREWASAGGLNGLTWPTLPFLPSSLSVRQRGNGPSRTQREFHSNPDWVAWIPLLLFRKIHESTLGLKGVVMGMAGSADELSRWSGDEKSYHYRIPKQQQQPASSHVFKLGFPLLLNDILVMKHQSYKALSHVVHQRGWEQRLRS